MSTPETVVFEVNFDNDGEASEAVPLNQRGEAVRPPQSWPLLTLTVAVVMLSMLVVIGIVTSGDFWRGFWSAYLEVH